MRHRVVRRGVFETNSSSTHSMTIGAGDLTDALPIGEDGKVHVFDGEFGWEPKDYTTPTDRAAYAYTYAVGSPETFTMLRDVIREHTGRDVEFHPEGGYIDHQSLEYGVPQEAFKDKATLAQFLFCPRSSVHTDNDNH